MSEYSQQKPKLSRPMFDRSVKPFAKQCRTGRITFEMAPPSATKRIDLPSLIPQVRLRQGLVYRLKGHRQLCLTGGCTGCGALLMDHAAIFGICPVCRARQLLEDQKVHGLRQENQDAPYDDSDDYEDFEDEYEDDSDYYEDFEDEYDDDDEISGEP